MEISLSRGSLRIAGAVDVMALRAVLDCLAEWIGLPAGTRIWITAGVTDLRRGFTGLIGMVQTTLQENPFSSHVFVFRGRRGDSTLRLANRRQSGGDIKTIGRQVSKWVRLMTCNFAKWKNEYRTRFCELPKNSVFNCCPND